MALAAPFFNDQSFIESNLVSFGRLVNLFCSLILILFPVLSFYIFQSLHICDHALKQIFKFSIDDYANFSKKPICSRCIGYANPTLQAASAKQLKRQSRLHKLMDEAKRIDRQS